MPEQRAVALGALSRWTRRLEAQLEQLELLAGAASASERVHDVTLLRQPEALVAAQERRFAARSGAPLWQVASSARAVSSEGVGGTSSATGSLLAFTLALGATLAHD